MPSFTVLPRRLIPFAAVFLWAHVAAAAGDMVACSYTYGGATQVVVARPVTTPYTVPAISVGSYFKFRVVFQTEPANQASIKVYTYVARDSGATPIHQATFPYPPAVPADARFGFTGQQSVYEPVRDSELQYWCRMQRENEPLR